MKRYLDTLLNLILIFLGFKMLQELRRSKRQRPCPDPNVTVDSVIAPYVPNQLIVWRKPAVLDSVYNRWKADIFEQHPGIAVKKLCESCDDTLELWEGDNITTIITGKTMGTSGGGSNDSDLSGGGDAVASFSRNFIVDFPDPAPCGFKVGRIPPSQPIQPLNTTPLTIAVFDTGLLDDLKTTYTKDVVNSCMPDGKAGWNFADKNKKTADDHLHLHGSIVSKFIKDQEREFGLQAINILPVKTHNRDGKGDLFSILCGFAYAKKCGAKIINASFGFYSAKEAKPPAILFEFVQRVLSKSNILLIAAAGNTNANKAIGRPLAAQATIRDLDKNPFFPACLSKDFQNVLTVTTVSETNDEVSPSQNYSNNIVDIGVKCDATHNDDYYFNDPFGQNADIIGSSYATPIVTGKIAQHYTDLTAGMESGIDKEALLERMKVKGLLNENDSLSQYVKDGNWIKKGI